jgi:peptide-methionine (R)-S-oxide reductase
MKNILSLALMAIVGLGACNAQEKENSEITNIQTMKVQKTDSEWKKELNPEQYNVLREAGTERPFTGEYTMHFEDGNYKCAGCQAVLFDSESKFESHCGWPSFDKAADNEALIEKVDRTHGMARTEILCAGCGGHLGHVFDDGPTETGKRYCINSAALGFKKEE